MVKVPTFWKGSPLRGTSEPIEKVLNNFFEIADKEMQDQGENLKSLSSCVCDNEKLFSKRKAEGYGERTTVRSLQQIAKSLGFELVITLKEKEPWYEKIKKAQ